MKRVYELVGSEEAGDAPLPQAQRDAGKFIGAYLQSCVDFATRVFAEPRRTESVGFVTADDIIQLLLAPEFNYQSKGRVAPLLPNLRERIGRVIAEGRPLAIFFLYHGGYRADVDPERRLLTFSPDATELLLLYQIARLQEKLTRIYPPGAVFTIVINNGVAEFTNEIPIAKTEGYSEAFEKRIACLRGEGVVKLLVQSRLGCFQDKMRSVEITPWESIEPGDHGIVERFLGRSCSTDEACWRIARYGAAEKVWGREVSALVDEVSGFYCRQVAHPNCLSFRPFPGGAIRVQNGKIGFQTEGGKVRPELITSVNRQFKSILSAPAQALSIEQFPTGGLEGSRAESAWVQ